MEYSQGAIPCSNLLKKNELWGNDFENIADFDDVKSTIINKPIVGTLEYERIHALMHEVV